MAEGNGNGATLSQESWIRVKLDQVVRLVVVAAIAGVGWLARGQEAIRDELDQQKKDTAKQLSDNALDRQQLATKITVMDELGKEKLANLHGDLDRVEREFRELVAEVRAGKRSGS